MIVTFALVASIAVAGGSWLVRANQYGRIAALIVFAILGLSLLWPGAAFRLHNSSAPVEAKEATPKQVKLVEFSDSGQRKGVATVPTIVKSDDEWKQHCLRALMRLRARLVPSIRIPENTGTCTTRGFIAASAATRLFSTRIRSSSRVRVVQVSGSLLRRKMFVKVLIFRWEWREQRFPAGGVMRILGMFLMTDRNRLACATA